MARAVIEGLERLMQGLNADLYHVPFPDHPAAPAA